VVVVVVLEVGMTAGPEVVTVLELELGPVAAVPVCSVVVVELLAGIGVGPELTVVVELETGTPLGSSVVVVLELELGTATCVVEEVVDVVVEVCPRMTVDPASESRAAATRLGEISFFMEGRDSGCGFVGAMITAEGAPAL
jgi:hypothetical protein